MSFYYSLVFISKLSSILLKLMHPSSFSPTFSCLSLTSNFTL